MTARVSAPGKRLRATAQDVTDALDARRPHGTRGAVADESAEGLGANAVDTESDQASWLAIGAWLTGYALGDVPAASGLDDALEWFCQGACPQVPRHKMVDFAGPSIAKPLARSSLPPRPDGAGDASLRTAVLPRARRSNPAKVPRCVLYAHGCHDLHGEL